MALWILRRCRSFYSENKSLCETPRSWSDLTEDDFYSNDEISTIKVLVSQQDYRLFWFDWLIDQWNGLIDQHTKEYDASPNWFTIGCFRFPNGPGRKGWGWNGNRNRPNLERTLKGEGKGDPKSKKSGHDIILSNSKQGQSNLLSNREARKSVDVKQQIWQIFVYVHAGVPTPAASPFFFLLISGFREIRFLRTVYLNLT